MVCLCLGSEGGFFNCILTFPKDYPNSPPEARFTSDMWHPNGTPYLPSCGSWPIHKDLMRAKTCEGTVELLLAMSYVRQCILLKIYWCWLIILTGHFGWISVGVIVLEWYKVIIIWESLCVQSTKMVGCAFQYCTILGMTPRVTKMPASVGHQSTRCEALTAASPVELLSPFIVKFSLYLISSCSMVSCGVHS